VALADALEHRDQARIAALLSAYELAGVPVTTGRETAAGADDAAVGMPWPIVNAAALVPNDQTRLSLTDVVRTMHVEGLDLEAAAEGVTAGLRAALVDTTATAGVRPIAMLIAEESRRYNGVSLLDAATTADDVFVTVPTATLLVSIGIFTTLVAARDATAGTASSAAPSGFRSRSALPGAVPRAVHPDLTTPPQGCAPDDAFGQWALWLVSKFLGGVDLVNEVPGLKNFGWGGVFGGVVDAVLSEAAAATARVVATWVSTALTVLTTVVAAMTFSALVRLQGGEPLVRTHSSRSRGAVDTILVTVTYDFGDLGADTVRALNCILVVLVAIGNNATLPVPGPVGEGVAVTIHGERPGFGEGIDTNDAFVELDTPLTDETDDTGTAEFTVAGRPQKKDMPENAESYDRTFTVALSAKPDPTDLNTIIKTFLDSVLCVPGTAVNPSACADPITDILRQFNWDLGQWVFTFKDWRSGWAIHDSLHPEQSAAGFMHYDAVSCDSPFGPWHITVSFEESSNLSHVVTFDVILNADGVGTVTGNEVSTWDTGLNVTGSSTGTAQLTKVGIVEGEYELLLDYVEMVSYSYPGMPWLNTHSETHHIKTIKVIPATMDECG
jgi:hypothetical protein